MQSCPVQGTMRPLEFIEWASVYDQEQGQAEAAAKHILMCIIHLPGTPVKVRAIQLPYRSNISDFRSELTSHPTSLNVSLWVRVF